MEPKKKRVRAPDTRKGDRHAPGRAARQRAGRIEILGTPTLRARWREHVAARAATGAAALEELLDAWTLPKS